jgi:iron complex outermembrane receptor protein/vitamin B12 transporter
MLAAPKQQFNLSANYSVQKWNINASMQYINGLYSFISPNPTVSPIIEPDYLLCNLRVSCHATKRLELFASGNNLLNTHYEINYGYPLAGANFSAGINLKL